MKRIFFIALALSSAAALAKSPATIGFLERAAFTTADYGLSGPVSEVHYEATCVYSPRWNAAHEIAYGSSCSGRSIHFNPDGAIKKTVVGPSINTYQYDADGKLERITRSTQNVAVTRFFYDRDNPNSVRAVHYHRTDGSEVGESLFVYDSAGRLISSRGTIGGRSDGWDSITYDKSGRVTEASPRSWVTSYAYEYEGESVHPTTWYAYDPIKENITIQFEYEGFDEYGNWLTRRAHMAVMRFGETELEFFFEDRRTLNYY